MYVFIVLPDYPHIWEFVFHCHPHMSFCIPMESAPQEPPF